MSKSMTVKNIHNSHSVQVFCIRIDYSWVNQVNGKRWLWESDYTSPLSYISTFEIKKHETLTFDNGLQLGFDAKVETDGAFFLPKEMTVLISLPRMK